jgi:hypothetical protein
MAKKTLVQFIDDLDGSVIPGGMGRSVMFEFDGTVYEIDLTDAHVDELRDVLAPYVAAGRRTSRDIALKQRRTRSA